MGNHVREVKYFHPSGRSLPNGSNIQRGGFLNECHQNRNAYTLDETVHGEQYGSAKFKGGVDTFPTEAFKQQAGKDKINEAVGLFTDGGEERIGAYSVGNFFHGGYVGDDGEVYDGRSVSVEVNGLGSKSLVKFARHIAKLLCQETVLVKDLNTEKILLVASEMPQ